MRKSYWQGPRYEPDAWHRDAYTQADEQVTRDPPKLDKRALSAIHEAGHVIATCALGLPCAEVFVKENGGGGMWHVAKERRDLPAKKADRILDTLQPCERDNFFPIAIVSLAGGLAQARIGVSFDYRAMGCSKDWSEAIRIIQGISTSEAEADQLLVEGIRQANALLGKHWDAVVALAWRLYFDRHLEADAIAETLRPFGFTVSDRRRASPKPAAKPKKPKQKIDHMHDDRDAPISADLARMDG